MDPQRLIGLFTRPAERALAAVLLASALMVPAPSIGASASGAAASAGAAPITVPFDHLPTGFELDGVHRDLPCEACHLNAVFKGTPRDCGVCHITGSVFNATPKTARPHPDHEQLRGLP